MKTLRLLIAELKISTPEFRRGLLYLLIASFLLGALIF